MVKGEVPFQIRLAEARQMLAHARLSRLATHEVDQVQAACRHAALMTAHTAEVLKFVQPWRGWREKINAPNDDEHAYLVAAILGCQPCIHLRKEGPQPAIAQLPVRLMLCQRCAATLRKPPADEDDRCDVCGRRGVGWFVPFIVRTGTFLVGGDACGECADAMHFDTAEAVA